MTGAIERIVVALDAVSENRTAIGTAARLAARWQAHLHGIFVEDDDLIRLAHLPFARQVTLGLGVEPLNLHRAERQVRAFAARARHDLAAAAKRHGVEWSFEITSGQIGAGSAGDFLVFGTTTRPIGGHFRVEGRWWSAVAPASASLLLAHRERHEGTVAAIVRDREPHSERLLQAAARLAEVQDGLLTVLCPRALTEAPGFQAWLRRCLSGQTAKIDLDVASAELAALIQRIVELNCGVVALAAGAGEAQPDRLRDMVAKIGCDVLVVR
jgi:hypothetical protein